MNNENEEKDFVQTQRQIQRNNPIAFLIKSALCRSGYLAYRNSDRSNLVEVTNMAKKESKNFDFHC